MVELAGSWEVVGTSPDGRTMTFAGTVPGCVNTDLQKAGLIPADLFWRDNADAVQWIEEWDWTYTRRFTLDTVDADAVLVFEELDTYADIRLNGKTVGFCDDMFIPWRFAVGEYLQKGINTLEVRFHSPTRQVAQEPPRWGTFTNERVYTRRMQCTYGWDWVIRLLTVGISGAVYIQTPAEHPMEDVYIRTVDVTDGAALMACEITASGAVCGRDDAVITVTDPCGAVVYQRTRRMHEPFWKEWITLPRPMLWYPNGYGEQPLYTLEVCLQNGDAVRQQTCHMFGIRTLRVLQPTDAPDSDYAALSRQVQQRSYLISGYAGPLDRNDVFSGFTVVVNGVRVFCKGGNWVPCEPFPSCVTAEKYDRLVRRAQEMHYNMLRVWGGGRYENEAFYDACDRYGILVVQDLLMACGSYPEEREDFLEKLRAETAHAAQRLRRHACLAWWAGDNENGIDSADDDAFTGRKAALVAAAPVLCRYDPDRLFLPTSPYGGRQNASATQGTTHNTKFLGAIFKYIRETDMTDYQDFFGGQLSRFNAELPVMGAASRESLLRFMTADDMVGEDECQWEYHTQSNPALPLSIYGHMRLMAEKLFGTYRDGHDRMLKLQYLQYLWICLSLETYRRYKGYTSGALFWMYNDCWPTAVSWSMVDYDGAPKAAYYAFRRTAQPTIGVLASENDGYSLYVCHDGQPTSPVSGTATVAVLCMSDGQRRQEWHTSFSVPANESTAVLRIPSTDAVLDADCLLVADLCFADGTTDRCRYYPARPQDRRWPSAHITLTVTGEDTVTVKADRYVHAVLLDGAEYEDNYFSLYPNEERTVRYCHPTGDLTAEIIPLN